MGSTAINWLFRFIVCLVLAGGCETVDQESLSSQNLWGEAGSAAYVRAAREMADKSPPGVALEPRDKEALRVAFPDLVDQVWIHWDAEPLDELAAAEYGIRIGSGDTEAQTYGFKIYMRGPRSNWPDRERLTTLIHELIHTEQFVRYGSKLDTFGYYYFSEYYEGGQTYRGNSLEQEAFNRTEVLIERVWTSFQGNQP